MRAMRAGEAFHSPDANTGSTKLEVDDAGWCLTSCSRWKTMEGKRKEEERLMIHNLTDCSFAKVCIDSGAGESVCPATPSRAMS